MHQLTRVHFGRVSETGDRMFFDEPEKLADHKRALAGRKFEMVLRPKRNQRTRKQDKWLRGIAVRMLADCLGYEPQERDVVHYAMLAEYHGKKHDAKFGLDVPAKTSSQHSTVERSEYMEWFVRYAAQKFGCIIPLPNESDLDAIEDEDA